jgi:threonine dehydrogenase-like Zn-dependent dehydrogenase
MKVSVVTSPGETQVVAGPTVGLGMADVLVKIRACGICGTDAVFISMGGIPGHDGSMPSPCPSGGRYPQGASHVMVADLTPARLEKAIAVGADEVINSAEEDVANRLLELHGARESLFPGKVGTDIYFDAAGAPAVIDTAAGKPGARLGVVAVHKQPVEVDFVNIMSNEITFVGSMGYPTKSSKSPKTSSPTGKNAR